MTKTTTYLTHIALAKVLMKGHDCLTNKTAFEMFIHQEDGKFVLVFTAKDHMDGYDHLSIDLHITDTAEEMDAWLANGRVSTRVINKTISEYDLYIEAYEEVIESFEVAAIEAGLMKEEVATHSAIDGKPLMHTVWVEGAFETHPLIAAYSDYTELSRIENLKDLNKFVTAVVTPLLAGFKVNVLKE